MKRVFFDTWGWVAVAHKDDASHARIVSFYKAFLVKKGIPITTDYILAETITLLRARTEHKGVIVFINTLLSAIKEGRVLLERIDEKRWEICWRRLH